MTITPGEKCILTITDVAFGGQGVGRVDDFVIFVPFVLTGEIVEVEMLEVRKRFGRGRLLRVLHAAPGRVKPECRYFGECGGCQYQHVDYQLQLKLKGKQVCDLFHRIGGLDPGLVTDVVPCPAPYHYRNRIMIRSQWDKYKQGLNIGYLRAHDRLVVDIDECKIAEPALNEQIRDVRRDPPPKGGLKVLLRIPPAQWEVPRDSFFQNNFHLLPKLVETVREYCKDSGNRHLLDLYCGVGFFSLELADLVDSFVGVELDAAAIKAARRNATNRGCSSGEFVTGDAQSLLPSLLSRFLPSNTSLVLDPPRTGCQPNMLSLLRHQPPSQIIYVSCHPATMARDLNVLCADGVFTVRRVVPLDMFPQTAHVECVADLRMARSPASSIN